MPELFDWQVLTTYWPYATFLFAGLAGSVHCLGMCGPILMLLMGANRPAREPATKREQRTVFWDRTMVRMMLYHTGRIWTYMLLGLLAGGAGAGLRWQFEQSGLWYDWQRVLGLIFSALLILASLTMTGLLSRLWDLLCGLLKRGGMRFGNFDLPDWSQKWHTCTYKLFGEKGWFKQLVYMPHPASRLLLGAMMGFIPCGLVYAVLILAASLPTPLHAAMAMFIFGLGTLPALSSLILSVKLLPFDKYPKLNLFMRQHGSQVAAMALLLTGLFMGWRAWASTPEKPCPACESQEGAMRTKAIHMIHEKELVLYAMRVSYG